MRSPRDRAHRSGSWLRTIAVYSAADANALPTFGNADGGVSDRCAPAPQKRLVIDRLIDVARQSGAQCIHPGYGFSPRTQRLRGGLRPRRAGLRRSFTERRSRAMGPKPPRQSSDGAVRCPGQCLAITATGQRPRLLIEQAYRDRLPGADQGCAGGGGKGMRRVERAWRFRPGALAAAPARGQEAAFGDDRVLIENVHLSSAPRHIELQIFR